MGLRKFAITIDAGEDLPAEFRLFTAGVNDSTKGPALFDQAAAKLVMAEFELEGVDLMIDLDHMSLDPPSLAGRSDSTDARGWFQLEVRDGELWAVNVRWTPDGQRRLAEKTQRYISPAFFQDEEGRVTEMLNAALVAMPATHDAPALVAARKLAHEASADAVRTAVSVALDEAHRDQDGHSEVFVVDMFSDSAVFELRGELFQVPFSFTEGKATFSGDPERVVRTYTPAKVAAKIRAARYLIAARKAKAKGRPHGS